MRTTYSLLVEDVYLEILAILDYYKSKQNYFTPPVSPLMASQTLRKDLDMMPATIPYARDERHVNRPHP